MMTLSPTSVQAARELQEAGRIHALIFGFAIFVFSLVIAFISSILGAYVLQVPGETWQGWLIWIFASGSFLAGTVILFGFVNGASIVSGFMLQWVQWQMADRKAKYEMVDAPPAPSTPPAPPAGSDTFNLHTPANREGEVVQKKLLNGFDVRDILALCHWLADGGKFTEAAWEHFPLMYTGGKLGKAAKGTRYTLWLDWLCESGIILGRDPKHPGTLAVLEVPEMMKRLKESAAQMEAVQAENVNV